MRVDIIQGTITRYGTFPEGSTVDLGEEAATFLIQNGIAKKWIPESERDGVEYGRLGGSKIVQKFLILHAGWECDNEGYVTEDGRIWWTSHNGRPYEAKADEFMEKLNETRASLNGLLDALTYRAGTTEKEK